MRNSTQKYIQKNIESGKAVGGKRSLRAVRTPTSDSKQTTVLAGSNLFTISSSDSVSCYRGTAPPRSSHTRKCCGDHTLHVHIEPGAPCTMNQVIWHLNKTRQRGWPYLSEQHSAPPFRETVCGIESDLHSQRGPRLTGPGEFRVVAW